MDIKIPHCNICGRLIRKPKARWVRGDGKTVACLACLRNYHWMEKATESGKSIDEVKIGEERDLFSDNQFEADRLFLLYRNR